MKRALIAALCLLAVAYIVVLVKSIRRARNSAPEGLSSDDRWLPTPLQSLIGFVTNFFDTLGIGNFAPTTAWFRYAKLVPDELIPGTMNVGHTLPVMLMAFLYIEIVEVETATLLCMIGSAVLGAWFGAGVVSRLPRKRIQISMGGALIAAALLMAAFQFDLKPKGAEALGLEWEQAGRPGQQTEREHRRCTRMLAMRYLALRRFSARSCRSPHPDAVAK